MGRTSEVIDPGYRAELVETERLLDEGDYDEVVRRSVDIYRRLATARPDLIIRRSRMELSVTSGRPERLPFAPWPDLLGVTLQAEEGQPPTFRFDKTDFAMSEAITYFEYALEAVVRAQDSA